MLRSFILSVIVVIFFGIPIQANAVLTTIGQGEYLGSDYNLIWDSDSPFGPIVWLDYTHSEGIWQNQVDWAAGLNGGGVLTYNINPIYSITWNDGWRLPETVNGPYTVGYDGSTTAGYNITSSELGHLYYAELGNQGAYDTSGNATGCLTNCLTNTGDFQNLQRAIYWSGTENSANLAWAFSASSGVQWRQNKDFGSYRYAMSVRPGDVAVVPEPMSMVLFVVGGAVMAARMNLIRRRN